jgi:hypothetical protein
MDQFLKFIFGRKHHIFPTVTLYIIRSFSLYTKRWYMPANLYDIYQCCVYSKKTPNDGQRNCPKYVDFQTKTKFEKLMHLVGFIIRNLTYGEITNYKISHHTFFFYFPLISLSWYIEISKIWTKSHKMNITLLTELTTLEAKTLTWSNTAVFGNGESCKDQNIGWQGRHRTKTEWRQHEISNNSSMEQYRMYPASNAAK